MKIGVPKEIKAHEYRVGLTPEAVREYAAAGHDVLVETGAGSGINSGDDIYLKAGASIASSAREVYATAQLIIKVKEPQRSEWELLRDDHLLFAYLHLAPDPEQTRGLLNSGCTAIAYETISDEFGGLPLLAPMSEIAGRLSIEAAGAALKRYEGGPGLLLGGVPGVRPSRVVVIGGGVVGTHAARMAVGLGADVSILDRSLTRLRQLDEMFQGRVRTLFSTLDTLEHEVTAADVIIGAVLVPGGRTPKLISRDMLKLMKQGALLVDVAIDQGGCFETSRSTTHDRPTYTIDGIIHYCVSNMPGAVPLTATYALNNATLPFGLALAGDGIGAIIASEHLQRGLNVHRGRVTNRAVADNLGLACTSSVDALVA